MQFFIFFWLLLYHYIAITVGNVRADIVRSEIPFGVDSYCMDTSQFTSISNHLPDFCIVRVSPE